MWELQQCIWNGRVVTGSNIARACSMRFISPFVDQLQCKHTKILENLSELKQLVFSEEWYLSYQENRKSTSAKTLFLLQIMRVSDVNRH